MRKIYLASLLLIVAGVFGIWKMAAWAGTTWTGVPINCTDPSTPGCNTDGVVWSRPNPGLVTAQTGGFNIGGDAYMGNDVYLNAGKAIRIDKTGSSILNIANFSSVDPNAYINVNILGNVNLTNRGTFSTPTLTAYQVKGTNSLCIGPDCRTAWPSGAGGTVTSITGGTGLDGGNITTAGTLSVSQAYQLPQSCALDQVPKWDGTTKWTCQNDIDTNSGGDLTEVTGGTGIAVTNGTGPIPDINLDANDSLGCTNGQLRVWDGTLNKWYCTSFDAIYVKKSGDSMTGALSVAAPYVVGGASIITNAGSYYGIYAATTQWGNFLQGARYGVYANATGVGIPVATPVIGGGFNGRDYGVNAVASGGSGIGVYGTGPLVGGRFNSANVALEVQGVANIGGNATVAKDFAGSTLKVTNNYSMNVAHIGGQFIAGGDQGVGVESTGYSYGIKGIGTGPTAVGIYGQETSGSGYAGRFDNINKTSYVLLGATTKALETSGKTLLGGETDVNGSLDMQAGQRICFNNAATPGTDCISAWPTVPSTANFVQKTGDTMTGALTVTASVPGAGVITGDNAAGSGVSGRGSIGIYGYGATAGSFWNSAANGPKAFLASGATAGQFVSFKGDGSQAYEINLAGGMGGVKAHATDGTSYGSGWFTRSYADNTTKHGVELTANFNAIHAYSNGDLTTAYIRNFDITGTTQRTSMALATANYAMVAGGNSLFNGDVTINGKLYVKGGTGGLTMYAQDATAPTSYTWFESGGRARLKNDDIGNPLNADYLQVGLELGFPTLWVGPQALGTGCVKQGIGTVIGGSCASDISLKTNIEPITGVLGKLTSLQPVTFDWKENGRNDYGLIAQQVEKTLPELVETDEKGLKSVHYDVRLQMLMLESIKELKLQNDMLQAENNMLLQRLDALEAKVK